MKNKFNTATFLRQLTLTLLVAMLAAAFQTARAQDSYPEYISEVKVLGCADGTSITTVSDSYTQNGWTLVDYDLNKGAYGDHIYLIYKKTSRNNTDGGYITDFIVSDVETPSNTLTYNGRTYHLCSCDGYSTFTNSKGNLNRGANGRYVYLYYTTDNFDDKRAVTGISFDATSSNAVQLQCTTCQSGTTTYKEADFNRGAEPGSSPNIYMHITTATKSNRPSNDPVMASGLTFNGSAQTLLSINNTNTGTMMYSVNDGGFSSTIPTATDAGTYTVKYYAASNNYGDQSETKSQTVSIAKATNNKVTTTAALNLTYNGSAQNLINAYSATFGTIQYSLDGTNYSATVPQGKDAKTYTIHYKVAETSNYNGVSGTATATIKKAANNNATVSIANTIDGRENVNPTVNDNLSTGTITYQYSKSSNSGFSTAKPNAPGTWYVKATIAADDNCEAYTTATKKFTLIDWEGDGTSSSPYLIKTTTDLDRLAQRVNAGNQYTNYHFRVENNITYGNTTGNNFTAIGTSSNHPFSGTFDGGNNNGYTISGIRINASSDYQGLFGYVEGDATIQNVTLEDAEITCSTDMVGGIAGRNNGSISNCTSSATVSSSGNEWWYYGGIAGRNYGSISNCTSSATVSASGKDCSGYGGIVGYNDGTLTNNLAIDAVISTSSHYYGAIAGKNWKTLQNNFYYNTTVNGATSNVGWNGADITDNNGALQAVQITADEGITFNITSNNSLTYENQIYVGVGTTVTLAITDAITTPDGVIFNGYTYAEGKSLAQNADGNYTFTVPCENVTISRDITDLWNVENDADGSADHPYIIMNPAGLDLLATNVNSGNAYEGKYFKLGANITYSYAGLEENGSNFTAIGNSNNPFNGNFDGDGKTISGIRIYKPNDNYQGLFGCIEAAIVENIILTDTKITGSDAVGGIVGFFDTGTIRNCIVADNVYINGIITCGGIAGHNYGSLSNNLVVNAEINSSTNGAIFGYNNNKLANNFYYNCKVGGTENATNVGGGDGDITTNNGARQIVKITADEGITFEITSNNSVTYENQIYVGVGTTVTLAINDANTTPDGVIFNGYIYAEGKSLAQNADGDYTFTVPSDNVTISRDITDFWGITNDADGSADHPYIITTPAGLVLLATKVNSGYVSEGKYFQLGADITYSYAGLEETGSNFTAIGNYIYPFNGNFDGDGKTISGIRINRPNDSYQGLFGGISNANVENIILADAKITGNMIVGGIAGACYESTIRNCIVDNVFVNVSSQICGGIAGSVDGTLVGNLIVNSTITVANPSESIYTGAITGYSDGTLQNNFYYNTTVNGATTEVGCNGADIEDQNGAVPPDFIIDGDSETPVAITESNAGANVLYLRKLKKGVTSTITLPFDFNASSMDGIFYQLTSVNTDDWTAGANIVTGTLSANTPYLFLPNADIEQVMFPEVTLTPTTGSNSVKIDDHWTFHGVYEKILWETAPDNHYGFSAINKGDNIAAGDFVKIGQYVRIKPTRAYLTYNDGISKSAIVLPDRIHVVFSDEEIASVIDPIDTPTDDPTEDITTPVSELPAQASNVKVWSYEKTIYIQAAPMTDYRIIDATGRVLRSATTQTDRDEIRLGNHSGIVIVIINHKTYKINY